MSSLPYPDNSSSFLSGENAAYIAHLYTAYCQDPLSVDNIWREYFSSLEKSAPEPDASHPIAVAGASSESLRASLEATKLIQAYRTLGHKLAHLDPLGLTQSEVPLELRPDTYGFTNKESLTPLVIEDHGALIPTTFQALTDRFNQIYGGTIGIEFAHIENKDPRLWLQHHMEGTLATPPLSQVPLETADQKALLYKLIETELFEQFLHKKHPGATRFGLDGAESLIPGIEEVLVRSSLLGVEEVVIGMPHRGRLNVLTHILGKPTQAIFAEFQGGEFYVSSLQESGDVNYHLGASVGRTFGEQKMHLSLMPNPSHLEAVNPLVVGKVRAHQAEIHDHTRSKIMGLLLHGDAAFAGQGIVAETLMLSRLKGYETGGTFHIVVNNQIGFTTLPQDGRSSSYCSDWALVVQAPVFHVNGEDPEAVLKVMRLAALYRHTFKSDVVVDLVCYRRFGHNEGDEPSFTQPHMAKAISARPFVSQIYGQRLLQKGHVTEKDILDHSQRVQNSLLKTFEEAATYSPPQDEKLGGSWKGYRFKQKTEAQEKTGVDKQKLQALGTALIQIPKTFHLHPKLKRLLDSRQKMIKGVDPIDWSMAEALAFASLLDEGYPVRLSGQDSSRGTFSQRHSLLRDQETEEKYCPFNHLSKTQAFFEVCDSPLAEASVLGFEVGYSFADPKTLVLWEAQYGDFSNGGQVIIDQFLTSAETKWLRMSGLVLLLPHAYEGQGPEHSSARLERYLQLCAEDNIQVVNCSTPANYFHALRQQLHRPYRKPLIIMTPKSLLRRKHVVSSFAEFEKGTAFQEVIPDILSAAKRVILCSGKIYYDLRDAREAQQIKDIALVRLEQFYPFPHQELLSVLAPYKGAEVVWCQEEPMNMGAWSFLDRRLEAVLGEAGMIPNHPIYVGRMDAASPATGLSERHAREQATLLTEALTLSKRKP